MVQGQEAGLTIGMLAQQAGVGVETVRYYQRRGLIRKPERVGTIRRYAPDDVRRLRFIRAAQRAGFTLDQAGELLTLDATNDRARANALARERLHALDTKIAELTASRDALTRLATACSNGQEGVCPILSAFDRN